MIETKRDYASAGEARERRRHVLHRISRRTVLLYSALVGILAGILAVLFQQAVQRTETFAASMGALAGHSLLWALGLATIAGTFAGLASLLIGKYAPEVAGSGIPHIKAALLHLRIIRPVRVIVAKFLGGLAALSVGMSLGREGPTVQMGASVGKFIGDSLRAPRRSRGALVSAGAGAGLAAAFNAPLAGFIFVMEELKREMSALTYGTALIASVCAVGVTRYLEGERPSFTLPNPGVPPLSILPLAALLGIVSGGGGVLFNKALLVAMDIRQKYHAPRWLYGGVVGFASALCLVYFLPIAGSGHASAETLLSGHFVANPLLLIVLLVFVGKLLLTASSYGTGLPGGIFAPILVMGSYLGYAFGLVSHHFAPGLTFSEEGFATLGMAGLLASSVRTPLTGVVLIVEMTAEYGLLYSLLVTAFVASLTAEVLRDKPVYDELMERDLRQSGVELHSEEEPLLLEILVEPQSSMDGRRIKNLGLPAGAIVATLERGSRSLVPGGSTIIEAGDMITVMVEGDKPELSHHIYEAARAPS
ncbi:MAG TPA: H(+)/Cl(-) exchange transporter ClcA [Fimbriimonadaceae bacterium]|nr:H(+)/Cl(-) exchange transporter ClcA [Fimbriimonadaceae bacterium]